MTLAPAVIEKLRRLVRAQGFIERLAVLRGQISAAVERDRAGLPPVSTGDELTDRMIARSVAEVRAEEGR